MNSLLAEIHNIGMFLQTLLTVGVYTGLILVPVVLIGYEMQGKRRA